MATSMILDSRGRPMRSTRSTRPDLEEYAGIGGGRDITRGYVSESLYLWPQDKVLRYAGATSSSYELYEDILQDDRVMPTFAQRRSAVVARGWTVEPGGTMRRDKMAAEFIRETLDHVRWDTVTDRMLYGVFYGYGVAECLWARDGRYIGLDRIQVRNRRRFVFGPDYRLLLLTNDDANGEPMPDRKFWHFAAGADNDDEPYGRGLAYWLYWPWWFKRNHVRFWMTFLEKFGMPTVVGKYPKSADPRARARLLDAARSVHADSAVTIPDDMMLELMFSLRSGNIDYSGFYDRMNDAITTVVLSQTMTTSDGSSLAQAEVHMDVRKEVVEADAHLIDDSFNRGPVAWLTEWNFPDGTAVPRVRRIMDDPADQKSLADRDKVIVDMGHGLTADYVERTYQVEVDRTATPPGPPRDGAPPRGTGPELAEDDPDDANPPVTDVQTERLRRDAMPLTDDIIDVIRQRVEEGGAESLEALGVELAEMLPDVDRDDLAALLGQAMMAAELAGRYDVMESE